MLPAVGATLSAPRHECRQDSHIAPLGRQRDDGSQPLPEEAVFRGIEILAKDIMLQPLLELLAFDAEVAASFESHRDDFV